jgi:hypothetical protein
MFAPRAVVLTVFIFGLPTGGAWAAEPPRADDAAAVAAGWTAARVGPVTSDAEKDSVGFAWNAAARECGLVPRFGPDVARHGPATGDAEKDSLGFSISDHEQGCGAGNGGGSGGAASR